MLDILFRIEYNIDKMRDRENIKEAAQELYTRMSKNYDTSKLYPMMKGNGYRFTVNARVLDVVADQLKISAELTAKYMQDSENIIEVTVRELRECKTGIYVFEL